MRIAAAALALLGGCSTEAQAFCRYDLYIYQPHGGPQIYAVASAGRSAAIALRACGDASFVANADDMVAQLEARRERGELDVVTVHGSGSRTYLGPCEADEDKERDEDDEENLVVIEDASAAQMRRTIQTLDGAPRAVREELIEALALRNCPASRR